MNIYPEMEANITKVELLLEHFKFEQNVAPISNSHHWLEWIWDIFWSLWIEVVGNGCLFATISYERFGMDPQKRTIVNQLLSQTCWSIITLNIFSFPMIPFRR